MRSGNRIMCGDREVLTSERRTHSRHKTPTAGRFLKERLDTLRLGSVERAVEVGLNERFRG